MPSSGIPGYARRFASMLRVRSVLPAYLERTNWSSRAPRSLTCWVDQGRACAKRYDARGGRDVLHAVKAGIPVGRRRHWYPHLMFFTARTDSAAGVANLKRLADICRARRSRAGSRPYGSGHKMVRRNLRGHGEALQRCAGWTACRKPAQPAGSKMPQRCPRYSAAAPATTRPSATRP